MNPHSSSAYVGHIGQIRPTGTTGQAAHQSQHTDTIVAIATAPGVGGIGVVRLSGPLAHAALSAVFRPAAAHFQDFVPRLLHFGRIVDSEGRDIDEALAVFFPAPHSFTGEDTAEIQGHGGPAVLYAIVNAVLAAGEHGLSARHLRLAEHGEFTRRAFLNGRMDLTQAEAVAEIIAAPSPEGVRLATAKLDGALGRKIAVLREKLEYLRQRVCLAVDFPDEDAECLPPAEFLAVTRDVAQGVSSLLAGYGRARCWSEGALVVLAGRVNAGKSSLMNALLGRERAIVTDRPGTTRDYLEEQTNFDGLPVRLVDTAGLRSALPHTNDQDSILDPIEQEGIRRARELMEAAQAVLVLFDGSLGAKNMRPDAPEWELIRHLGPERCLAVWNKADNFPAPDSWISLDARDNKVEKNLNLDYSASRDASYCKRIVVSARSAQGLDELAAKVRAACAGQAPPPEEIAPNMRQAHALKKTLAELRLLEGDINAQIPPDLCGLRLEAATAYLADVTGKNSTEETLNAIFADFCIGK